MSVTEELYRKALAERDSYKDLAESAIIATAFLQYGKLCSGKVVRVGSYYFRIRQNNGEFSADLIEVQP